MIRLVVDLMGRWHCSSDFVLRRLVDTLMKTIYEMITY
jgi:hypothetical protein